MHIYNNNFNKLHITLHRVTIINYKHQGNIFFLLELNPASPDMPAFIQKS